MLQQYRLGNTFYGFDASTGQLVAFPDMKVLQQYFPGGIDPNAQQLPVDPTQANAQPGQIVTPQNPSMPTNNVGQNTNIDFSRGNQFLLRFPTTHGNTVYLYDKIDNFYVPFTSALGFQAFTGMDPSTAYNEGYITDSTTPPVPGQIVPDQYGFDNNGQISPEGQTYIRSKIASTANTANNPGGYTFYGQNQDTNKEKIWAENLTNVFSLWAQAGAITQSTYNNIALKPENLAKYIHAAVYGGYTLPDIFSDIKAQELGQLAKSVSTTQKASDYYNTSEYASTKNNSQLAIPANISTNQALINSPLASMSDNAFKTLVQPIDITAPSVKEQALNMANVAADLALQQINATSEQDKAVADQNYEEFKKTVEQTLGFSLSNDAMSAWTQLMQMSSQAEQGYISNSGVLNSAQDFALNQRRIYDEQLRKTNLSAEEAKQREYLLNSGTPEQIAALTPEQRQNWGLTPSSELTNYLNTLQANNPSMPPEEYQAIKNMFIDQNGNVRSQLYQNLYKNQYTTVWGKEGKVSSNLTKTMIQNDTAAKAAEAAAGIYDTTDPATGFLPGQQKPTPPPATSSPTTNTPPPGLQMPTGYSASNPTPTPTPTPTPQPQQQPTGLQMPSTTAKPTFNSYVKTANSPTVYGVTAQGQYVGFENENQFLNAGGSWGNVKTVNSVSNPVNYSQYRPPGS